MDRNFVFRIAVVLLVAPAPFGLAGEKAGCRGERNGDLPNSRTFRLDYGGSVDGLAEGARVRVWLPVPQSGEHQTITMLKSDLPAEGQIATEPTYRRMVSRSTSLSILTSSWTENPGPRIS